jgi:hypothetical protein
MRAEDEDGKKRWHRFRLSALEHPNVRADLEGRKREVPGAVNLAMVNQWVDDWTEPIPESDRKATDLYWQGRWRRPGAIFQARCQGLWPDQSDGVWSPALFEACCTGPEPPLDLTLLPEIGCDCATGKGDDFHAIHVRWGGVSLHHETSNTMDASRIYERLRAVCDAQAGYATGLRPSGSRPVDPRTLRVKLDDDGTGNAVAAFLKRDGYNALLVSAAGKASRPDKAKQGLVHFGRLDRPTRARLRQQFLAPAFELNQASGLLLVEPKDVTKEKILRSPDDADAANLAYLDLMSLDGIQPVPNPTPRMPWRV